MSDDSNLLEILEQELLAPDHEKPTSLPSAFDVKAYLQAYPDIATAIQAGEFASASDHYLHFGYKEGRLESEEYLSALVEAEAFPSANIDALFMSASGHCLVIGWINDGGALQVTVSIAGTSGCSVKTRELARCRREDAEGIVPGASGRLLGFWTVVRLPFRTDDQVESVTLTIGSQTKKFPVEANHVSEAQFGEIALEYFASCQYHGNSQLVGLRQLGSGIGRTLIDLNIERSETIIAKAHIKRFGHGRGRIAASMVVCIYGKLEFLFLQAAMFSAGNVQAPVEWIYVCNSPELVEGLLKEAQMAADLYGVQITIVALPGNAGFGAANNAAVTAARSDRIVIINPDVFPRGSDWAQRLIDTWATRPEEETRLFGVPLYYDDGSLMHGGMHFTIDEGLVFEKGGVVPERAVRVEHYGKGAPPDFAAFLAARPVPAVTGAFIAIDRDWFEKLGGFSMGYVYGHYEDADLCLKSYARGQPAWLHNIPFWHLEGKGSTRRLAHEGGSIVNRWLFTETWGELIEDELNGRQPVGLARPSRALRPVATQKRRRARA